MNKINKIVYCIEHDKGQIELRTSSIGVHFKVATASIMYRQREYEVAGPL